jgi:hypothetical protein
MNEFSPPSTMEESCVCLGEKGREGLCFWRGEHLLSDLVCRWQHRSAPISCAGCISCQACRDHAHFSLSKAGTHTQICSNQLFRLLARQLENTMPSVLLSNVATNEMAREYYFFHVIQATNLVLCTPCWALLVSASFSVCGYNEANTACHFSRTRGLGT